MMRYIPASLVSNSSELTVGCVFSQAATSEAQLARDTIFSSVLQAFNVRPAAEEETTTLADLKSQLAAKYPGIQAEFDSLRGTEEEKRSQV